MRPVEKLRSCVSGSLHDEERSKKLWMTVREATAG
jgi:hypothetical protein